VAKPKANDALRFQQVEAGKQALGAYQPLLQWAMQNAGLPQSATFQPPSAPMPQPPVIGGRGGFGMQQPMASTQPVGGPAPFVPGNPPSGVGGAQPPGVPNSALGVFGQGADALRFQQAEEDISDAARQRANLLRFRLGQQGIGGGGIAAAAQVQNERGAMDSLADFRRNLAINAGGEQERRMQLLAQLLGLGQGIGSQGQAVSGQYKQIEASKPGLLGSLAPFATMFAPIRI
jgi:hypothetical protein